MFSCSHIYLCSSDPDLYLASARRVDCRGSLGVERGGCGGTLARMKRRNRKFTDSGVLTDVSSWG